MKLSDLRPCICCGGKIVPLFHMITIVDQVGALDRKATNEVLGLTQMLGGIGNAGAFAIAECMSPGTDDAVKVLGEGRELGRLPLALSNSFAFGGSNVVLAFRQA